MTNFEKIKNMDKHEMVLFINDLIDNNVDKSIPFDWFDRNYCQVCPDIEVVYEGKNELWKECDFETKCPHQEFGNGLINLWLDSDVEVK